MSRQLGDFTEQINRMQASLVAAILDRKTITLTYHLMPGRKIEAQMLADCERAVNGWVVETLRGLGVKIGKRYRLIRLDMNSYTNLPDEADGHEYLRLEVDFARILGRKPDNTSA